MGKEIPKPMEADLQAHANWFGTITSIKPNRQGSDNELDLYSPFSKWVFSLFNVKCLPIIINDQLRYVKRDDITKLLNNESSRIKTMDNQLKDKNSIKEISAIVRQTIKNGWLNTNEGL